MFISNLRVVLLIRVVNLVIGRLSTTNGDFCDLRVWQPDRKPSGSHFEKYCKPDGGVIRFTKQNDNQKTLKVILVILT